jgi:PadR family transcriptional regulator AphA
LKLFCGSAPAAVAEAQLANHQRRLSRYNELLTDELPEGQRLSLEAGIGHEREYIRFWTRLTRNG